MERSKGHIMFAGQHEIYLRGGEVFVAPANNPVMTDGYRCGRWECSERAWERYKSIILDRYNPGDNQSATAWH